MDEKGARSFKDIKQDFKSPRILQSVLHNKNLSPYRITVFTTRGGGQCLSIIIMPVLFQVPIELITGPEK